MQFWEIVRDQLGSARTPYLLAALVLYTVLVRSRAPVGPDPVRVRVPWGLFGIHVATQLLAGALFASGRDGRVAYLVSLAAELFAIVAMGTQLTFRVILPRLGLRVPRILSDIVTALAVLVVLIVVGQRAGFSVAGLITTSAVITAVIGFALQDTLGNIMGGLALQVDNSVRVGDWISLGVGLPQGRVIEIRWRYTAIETRAWETIIIPNALMMKSQVVVAGRRVGEAAKWRRQVDFYVDFRTQPTDVIHAVNQTLLADPVRHMAADPPPQVLFHGVQDSVCHYAVRYWLDGLDIDDPVDSDVRVRVYFALSRAGIPLAIPAQALFVTQETPERTQRKADAVRAERLAAIAGVDLFAPLAPEVRQTLAGKLTFAPFAHDETVTREGSNDDGLYIIVSGSASVRIGAGDDAREIARLRPGQFFGEMALMTGEARTATVVATSPLECYRMNKAAVQAIMRAHPEVADAVAAVLAERRTALDAAKGELAESRQKRMATAKTDLLDRIRGFFGINE